MRLMYSVAERIEIFVSKKKEKLMTVTKIRFLELFVVKW
jgi:hypothetical protein